eukprot:gb/GECH01009164.1/.p1 GENE.gb/GECH01009164.1/~~gb/GECH01009164.1/.p1  ORF type:complete len:162 (+),score=49.68 gb/GECH01009164.1/:1-486(+)
MQEPEKTFSEGLFQVLEPLAADYDSRVRGIQLSQSMLAEKIDALTNEMESAAAAAEYPDVSAYINKLSATRRRVFAISTSLHTIQERLTRVLQAAESKYPEMARKRTEEAQSKEEGKVDTEQNDNDDDDDDDDNNNNNNNDNDKTNDTDKEDHDISRNTEE